MTWVVVGIIVLALVLLVVCLVVLMGHVRTLGLAVRRTRLRAEQAQRLRIKVETMGQRIEALQDRIVEVTANAEAFRARRGTKAPPAD